MNLPLYTHGIQRINHPLLVHTNSIISVSKTLITVHYCTVSLNVAFNIPTQFPANMKQHLTLCIAMITALMSHSALADAATELKAFPEATEGQQRLVIILPEKTREQETGFKLELVAGKMLQTDGINRMRLGATLITQPLQGWGYNYYELSETGATAGTLMAVPEGTPAVQSFVSATPLLIRYNSRLPVVVYLPDSYQLRYRIWSAPGQFQNANSG